MRSALAIRTLLARQCGGGLQSSSYSFLASVGCRSPSLQCYIEPYSILQPWKVTKCAFSSRKKKKKNCPFRILGISPEAEYKVAKTTFLKIAMENHPDTAIVETEEDRIKLREIFIKARRAFESLAEAPDGSIVLQEHVDEMGGSQNFDSWFRQETGHDTPFQFMSEETMKEVAEMTESVGGGLDRDGGMWTLANMVTNAVKGGAKDGMDMLRLEAGELKRTNDQIDGVLRRKRRHRR